MTANQTINNRTFCFLLNEINKLGIDYKPQLMTENPTIQSLEAGRTIIYDLDMEINKNLFKDGKGKHSDCPIYVSYLGQSDGYLIVHFSSENISNEDERCKPIYWKFFNDYTAIQNIDSKGFTLNLDFRISLNGIFSFINYLQRCFR